MRNKLARVLVAIGVTGLVPDVAFADRGEGLVEVILILVISLLNKIWPIVVPLFFLESAKKKISTYIYGVLICGGLAWSIVYGGPWLLGKWITVEQTVVTVRFYLAYIAIGTVLSFIASLKLIAMVREFNDQYD